MSLTPSQLKPARHLKGHSQVLAGAGSGKTSMLVHRIGLLMDSGVEASAILVVMFGRDPSKQFSQRLMRAYPNRRVPSVCTFHKLGNQFLIYLLNKEGLLDPAYKLEVKEYPLKRACLEALEKTGLSTSDCYKVVFDFMSFVDMVKSGIASPLHVFRTLNLPPERQYFIDAFNKFERKRHQSKIRYHADLIYDPVMFLHKNPEHIPKISNHFDHVMVDEYQDINDIQQLMIEMVSGSRASVMVVGDDDQCIFGWRGANPSYIISKFKEKFKGAALYEMPETFRYGNQLAMAAYSLISKNKNRYPKVSVASENARQTTITLDKSTAGQRSVASHILKHMQNPGAKLTDIAVLVRAYSHATAIEIGLLESGIPYKIEGGKPIMESPDIGSLMAALYRMTGALETMNQYRRVEIIERYIGFPNLGLDADRMKQLLGRIRSEPDEVRSILADATFDVVQDYSRHRIKKRADIWEDLPHMRIENAEEAIQKIIEMMGIEQEIVYISKTDEEKTTRWERFEAILHYARSANLKTIDLVNHFLGLMSTSKSMTDRDANGENSVLITSVHRSKGLEYPLVILPNLVEGKFPLIRNESEQSVAHLEDERRLFFVAMTRAMDRLVLIAPDDIELIRASKAGSDVSPIDLSTGVGKASRFLYEVNALLCQQADNLVKGQHGLLAKVKSPEKAVEYLVCYEAIKKLNSAAKRTQTST